MRCNNPYIIVFLEGIMTGIGVQGLFKRVADQVMTDNEARKTYDFYASPTLNEKMSEIDPRGLCSLLQSLTALSTPLLVGLKENEVRFLQEYLADDSHFPEVEEFCREYNEEYFK